MNDLKSIICFRTDKMGDLIVSTPFLFYLKKIFPHAKITCVLSEVNVKILQHCSEFEIITYRKNASISKKLKLLCRLRKLKPDCVFALTPKLFSYIGCWFLRPRYNGGMVYARGLKKLRNTFFLKHSVCVDRSSVDLRHHGLSLFDLLFCIPGYSHAELSLPPLYVPSSSAVRLSCNSQIIGIHLDARWLRDGWNDTDSANLCRCINGHYKGSKKLILTTDFGAFNQLPQILPKSRVFGPDFSIQSLNSSLDDDGCDFILVDRPHFLDWLSIIQSCSVWITYEGGSKHVASASNVPVVNIIRESSSRECQQFVKEWHPWQQKHKNILLWSEVSSQRLINEIINNLELLLPL